MMMNMHEMLMIMLWDVNACLTPRGVTLPTRRNCPECSNQYAKFRQSQSNHRSLHERLNYQSNSMDRRIKNKGVLDRLGKRAHDQNWTDHDEEKEYIWQEGQWCPGGLTRS
jgi:hypothetical protein